MHTNKELLEKAETHLQSGDIEAAAECLNSLKIAELVGSQSALYTRLCWRSRQAEAGLRYLNPLLKNKSYRASTGDWAEYAMCLNAIGAVAEGRNILKEKCASDPYYNIYMGFSLIHEWNYKEALSYLEKAVQQKDLAVYQIDVARVNLLSSYIVEDLLDKAIPLYEFLEKNLSQTYKRLRVNLKEIHLQLMVAQKRYEEALNCLISDYKQPPTNGPELFYYKKWKTIVEVEMGLQDLKGLLELHDEAVKSSMWEVARDCEARVAYKTGNAVFLKRIYYSTPWSSYRQRVLSKFQNKIDLSGPFDFWLSPQGHEPQMPNSAGQFKNRIDVEKGEIGNTKIKKGSVPHRILRALCSDLFRPHPVGGLFYKLFDNEKFDLASSPARIYRAVSELRDILFEARIPLEVEQMSQGYRLVSKEPICLILPSDRILNKSLIRLQPLKDLGKDQFSAKETADVLGVSLKTAQRILAEVINSGDVIKSGDGASTLYKWSTKTECA